MKKQQLIFILSLSTLFLAGCAGPQDTNSTSGDDEHIFCADDSEYFVFNNDSTLFDAIAALPLGAQETTTSDQRKAILGLLSGNDGYANTSELTIVDKVDYGVADVQDNADDFDGVYSTNITRYADEKILIGEYSFSEHYYDEDTSTDITTTRNADYQVFRNGFCPFVSRYYEIYDFADDTFDEGTEYIYDTENYLEVMHLVNGQALGTDLNSKYDNYAVNDDITSLSFTATKFVGDETGIVNGNASLNTHQSFKITITASYAPSGEALGEVIEHSVVIVDGMIKVVRDFQGTFELSGLTRIYHTSNEKNKTYSVEAVSAFSGTLLDPEDFAF